MRVATAVLGVLAVLVGAVGVPQDIALWYENPAALAVVVAALVAFARKRIPRLDGPLVIGFSLVAGLALAYAGYVAGRLGPDWPAFGLMAGALASGGMDLVRSVLRREDAPTEDSGPNPGPSPDADRARLR